MRHLAAAAMDEKPCLGFNAETRGGWAVRTRATHPLNTIPCPALQDGDKIKGKISDDEKKTVLDAVQDALSWMDENSEAEADEINDKRKEVEDVVNPIVAKIYGGEGGAPGGGGDDDDGDLGDHSEL